MSKPKKSIWQALIECVLPKTIQTQPAPDVDRNTRTLMRLEENDPVLACVRDHAVAKFGECLNTALDRGRPAGERLAAIDSASGVKEFIEELEWRRLGWNEERIRTEREAAQAKARDDADAALRRHLWPHREGPA
ncbi:MAG: hypothetical protein KGL39_54000 [Patescibacteria group bacterium]|nr:hypothetical protein [Patescibacteria group bacterium]